MRFSGKYSRLAVLVAALSLIVAACSQSGNVSTTAGSSSDSTTPGATSSTNSPPGGGAGIPQLRIAVADFGAERTEPSEMAVSEGERMDLMYDFLVGATWDFSDLSTESGVASGWESNADFTEWAFEIREGITFHNGEALAADDVVFTLERQIREDAGFGNSDLLRSLIDEVVAEGDHLVRVSLREPSFLFPTFFSPLGEGDGYVIPKDYFEEVGPEGFQDAPIGSGPYRLAEHSQGVSMTFRAVDEHWFYGKPLVDEINFLLVPEASTRAAMFQTGDVDIADVDRGLIPELEAAGHRIASEPNSWAMGFYIPQQWETDNPLSDVRVREALIVSVDRQEILDSIMHGAGRVLGIFHEFSWGYGVSEPMEPIPYDSERARSLLAEAGYGDGFQLDFHIYRRPGIPEWKDISEAVAFYWSEVGIEANIITTDFTTVRPMWSDQTFDTPAVFGPMGSTNRALAIAGMYNLYHSTGSITSVKDSVLDEALDNAASASTPEEYIRWQDEVRRLLQEGHNSFPLFEYGPVYATSNSVPDWWKPGAAPARLNFQAIFSSNHPERD